MSKIILNDEEFEFSSYSRNVYFNPDDITSSGYIGSLQGENLPERIAELAEVPITSISIKTDDDTVIYSLSNINARIIFMEEQYNGSDAVSTGINLQFNQ